MHHIKQKADGGEDTLENCIPLCFDCHSEVKAYNPKHPKGRMYTEAELIQHRDSWYKKVEQSMGIAIDDKFVKQDKEVFEKIKLIFDNETMEFIKKYHFGGSFDYKLLRPLKEFYNCYDNPEFEFFDIDLEGKKGDLKNSIDKFLDLISSYTQTLDIGAEDRILLKVPDDWEIDDPDKYYNVVKELNDAADKLWKVYYEMIKYCRMKLV